MEEKYLLLSMNDERIKEIAEIFGNKTCKKMIDYLSTNNEASEKDLADSLRIPINTVEYNLKKLVKSRLVEKTSNFFWSKKGKKIIMYKLSNKAVVISPGDSKFFSKMKSILPVTLISVAGALIVRMFYSFKNNVAYGGPAEIPQEVLMKGVEESQTVLMESTRMVADESANLAASASTGAVDANNLLWSSPSPVWVWFLGGAVVAVILFSILNWKKL